MNTPTKLKIHPFEDNVIISNSNNVIAIVNKKCLNPEERAAEIVTAVNYHDRLVDKLTTVKVALEKSTELDRKYWAMQIQQLLTEIEKSK